MTGEKVTEPVRPANGGTRLTDPSELTDKAIAKLKEQVEQYINGKVDVLEQRLTGMDTAVQLAQRGVEKVPAQMDEKIGSSERVTTVKFDGVATQLRERDERTAREAELNKEAVASAFSAAKEAVAAALTAQKEAASETNKSNTLAISKSELASQETINKLEVLFRTTIDAVGDKVDDLKDRVGRIESIKQGGQEVRSNIGTGAGLVATVISIIIGLIVIIGFVTLINAGP